MSKIRATAEVAGAAYLVGALAITLSWDDDLDGTRLAALAAWPVMLPRALVIEKRRRKAGTCPRCGQFFGSRAGLAQRHLIGGSNCVSEVSDDEH